MNYNVLKDSIAAVIKANGNEEITGDLLQQVLLSMVNILGSGYQFMGAAVPTTNPGTPDARVFYIATQAGTYTNFGSPAIVLDGTQIAVLLFASSWTSVVLSVPTKEYVDTALALKVDKEVGKGLSTNDLTDALVTLINGAFQKEDIAQDLGDSTTKVVSQAAITAVLLQYAKVDGYYAQLTAGAAENLVGRGSVPASFLRRTTGGTADVGTGSAKIAKLMGNSIVWNQLNNFAFYTDASGNNVTRTSTGGATNKEITFVVGEGGPAVANSAALAPATSIFIPGHKYLFSLDADFELGVTTLKWGPSSQAWFTEKKRIWQWPTNAEVDGVLGIRYETTTLAGTYVLKNIMVIDLTKMFGEGKEPSTVAEFEALFPLPYYAYEPGKVLPFAAEKLVTTGFNQWDEDWEYGIYSQSTGEKTGSGSDFLRCKNMIPVFPETNYFYYTSFAESPRLFYYDANGNYLGTVSITKNNVFTTPENAYFMTFQLRVNGASYANNICINLSWSGYRNGEYEPYELHESMFDPANWEDADGNKIFPYGGMHGVGTARDFATPDTDGFIRKATRIWDRRAYAAGDENDPAVITDGSTYTFVQLETPVETELAEPVGASYYANDFGTEEWQPANGAEPYTAPCDMNVAYAMNAVDTLRRLPENYISTGSFENFCSELATKLGAALNKNITITPTYDSENAEYDYSITIADIEG